MIIDLRDINFLTLLSDTLNLKPETIWTINFAFFKPVETYEQAIIFNVKRLNLFQKQNPRHSCRAKTLLPTPVSP